VEHILMSEVLEEQITEVKDPITDATENVAAVEIPPPDVTDNVEVINTPEGTESVEQVTPVLFDEQVTEVKETMADATEDVAAIQTPPADVTDSVEVIDTPERAELVEQAAPVLFDEQITEVKEPIADATEDVAAIETPPADVTDNAEVIDTPEGAEVLEQTTPVEEVAIQTEEIVSVIG
jgi:hypothetical protein